MRGFLVVAILAVVAGCNPPVESGAGKAAGVGAAAGAPTEAGKVDALRAAEVGGGIAPAAVPRSDAGKSK